MTLCLPTLLVSAVALSAAGATAATFGELSQAAPQPAPVAAVPAPTCPPYCAPAQRPPAAEGALPSAPPGAQPYVSVPAPVPMGYPPFGAGPGIAPGGPLPAWSFGQINSMSNPYNPWGLSTPFMYVPWSTPMSGWTNAATWNWWRERSGAPPGTW